MGMRFEDALVNVYWLLPGGARRPFVCDMIAEVVDVEETTHLDDCPSTRTRKIGLVVASACIEDIDLPILATTLKVPSKVGCNPRRPLSATPKVITHLIAEKAARTPHER